MPSDKPDAVINNDFIVTDLPTKMKKNATGVDDNTDNDSDTSLCEALPLLTLGKDAPDISLTDPVAQASAISSHQSPVNNNNGGGAVHTGGELPTSPCTTECRSLGERDCHRETGARPKEYSSIVGKRNMILLKALKESL